MDEDTKAFIENMLAEGLRSSFAEIRGYLDNELTGFKSGLNQPAEKEEPKIDPEDKTSEALLARIARLEKANKELADRDIERQKVEQSLRFDKVLSESLASKSDVQLPTLVKELLSRRLESAVEKDGKWYTPNGSLVTEEVDNFFKSEEGSYFLKGTHENGVRTPTTKLPPSGSSKVDRSQISLDEMLGGF